MPDPIHITIKKILIERSATHRALAAATGISESNLSRMLRGGIPAWDSLEKILDALDLEITSKVDVK